MAREMAILRYRSNLATKTQPPNEVITRLNTRGGALREFAGVQPVSRYEDGQRATVPPG
jgi:hypothetical protein